MRFTPVIFLALVASACGGPDQSQANNSAANISNDAQPENTAAASIVHNAAFAPVRFDPALIMRERHEGMEIIGRNFKILHRELDGSSPNLAAVRTSASQIAILAGRSARWFPPGTGPERGKTAARPEIWKNPRDFATRLSAFQHAAQGFRAMTAGADVDGMRAAYADLGGTCKACHDHYRTEMHH